MIWTFVYSLLELQQPGSFAGAMFKYRDSPQEMAGELMYFSNVTLTTLGYGDIVPVSKAARMFASLKRWSVNSTSRS